MYVYISAGSFLLEDHPPWPGGVFTNMAMKGCMLNPRMFKVDMPCFSMAQKYVVVLFCCDILGNRPLASLGFSVGLLNEMDFNGGS